jgi:hypothetical protein
MMAQALFLRTVEMAMQGIKQEISPENRLMRHISPCIRTAKT